MSKQNASAQNIVALVKSANDIISELQAENARLDKLAKEQAIKLAAEDTALTSKIPALVEKMASIQIDGKPLVLPDDRERFIEGMKKTSGLTQVTNQLIDRLAKVAAANQASNVSKGDLGEPDTSKTASAGDFTVASLVGGRLHM